MPLLQLDDKNTGRRVLGEDNLMNSTRWVLQGNLGAVRHSSILQIYQNVVILAWCRNTGFLFHSLEKVHLNNEVSQIIIDRGSHVMDNMSSKELSPNQNWASSVSFIRESCDYNGWNFSPISKTPLTYEKNGSHDFLSKSRTTQGWFSLSSNADQEITLAVPNFVLSWRSY